MWRSVSKGVSVHEIYQRLSRTCKSCRELIQQFPFVDANLNSSRNSILDSQSDGEDANSVWEEFHNMAKKYRKNRLKIAHINANSIGGFKFHEVKTWLLSGRLDILIISETKIDESLPNSQFQINGQVIACVVMIERSAEAGRAHHGIREK